MHTTTAPSRGSHLSPTALDELYARLKEHDPQWLEQVLQDRWLQIGIGECEVRKNPAGGLIYGSLSKNARAGLPDAPTTISSHLWPFDISYPPWSSTQQLDDHLRLFRDHDWARSSLGPMSSWSFELRYIVNLTLTHPRPAALWWGADRTIIYNEKYADILGARHPQAMGLPFDQVWPELISQFEPFFSKGINEGLASLGDNALFMSDRNGFREELWASWNIIPVPAENGGIGFFNPVNETTRQALTDRRLSTLLRLGQSLATAADSKDFWRLVAQGLRANDHDIPFAALYVASNSDAQSSSVHDTDTNSARSNAGSGVEVYNRQWSLQDTIGLPVMQPGLPSHFETLDTPENFLSRFAELLTEGRPTLLSIQDGTFPSGLKTVARSLVFDQPCDSLVFCPVATTHRENVLGFVLLGVNPCQQYDTDYEQFVELLVRQLSTSLASLVLMEEERGRAEEDRLRLSAQLAATQQIAVEHEKRFRNMADLAPVAMFHVAANGTILYANDRWFDLTQHPRHGFTPMSWYGVVHPDDHKIIDEMWENLGRGESVHFEIRLKKPFVTQDTINGMQVEGDTWIIAAAYTDKNEDGTVRGMLGCLTDISRQKWIEGLQSRRVEEATELRRQQENFMDMTSHEARNPLSAMTLCAESMISTFRDIVDTKQDPITVSLDTIQTHLEGAEVIMTCAQHQKRIIDDVLTLSKVDSGLLVIAPIEVRPRETTEQALKMLESEFQRGDIITDLIVTDAYTTLNVDWVRLDPSRILQVLINLLTNAIKFTRIREKRHITVTLDGSSKRPTSADGDIRYLGQSSLRPHLIPESEDDVYLSFAVRDTGTGIPADELSQLFQRFQQANPKTHVDYGGSGLGLFVCRELVKLQGGDIGVASEEGKGSIFAFFVRTTRCSGPPIKRVKHNSRGSLGSYQRSTATSDLGSSALTNAAGAERPLRSGQYILLVEDNLVNQRVMSMQLKKAGYVVSVAHHGQEALDFVRKSRFCKLGDGIPLDVILLDVEMPVMDGLTCVKHLRQMEKDGEAVAHVPVIAVTANARAEQQAVALDHGMDSVITKPFRMVELLPEIERVRTMHAID